jgi:hypothetical protein
LSAKWVRAKQWDDEHLTGAMLPIKWVLRALSSISLAVTLLVLVTIYGVLASIPIGLVALVPTYLFYGSVVVLMLLAGAVLPAWIGSVVTRLAFGGKAGAWVAGVLIFVGAGAGVLWAWGAYVWPLLRYNSVTGEGVRFFAEFCKKYEALPMRRLPGMEMSELEFYAWWPLTLVLWLFVVNMVVATIRRIEFKFENIGVLTVHTGIVVVALGSAYYASAKREGDVLLRAGEPDATTGEMTTGDPESSFYDNTRVVLNLAQGRGVEQWLIEELPRYNDYSLDAAGPVVPLSEGELREWQAASGMDGGRTLRIEVNPPRVPEKFTRRVDPDIRARVVGYAAFCDMKDAWVMKSAGESGTVSLRSLELLALNGPEDLGSKGSRVVDSMGFVPGSAVDRVQRRGDARTPVIFQYTRGMSDERLKELGAALPGNALWGLIVEIPELKIARTYPVQRGQRFKVDREDGVTAYEIAVDDLLPEPPLRVITPGFEGVSSSVAIVRVEPKAGAAKGDEAAAPKKAFTRYVYSLYPELNQDLSEELNERGMPKRTAADGRIKLTLVDASGGSIFIDERTEGSKTGGAGTARVLVRLPGRDPVLTENVVEGQVVKIAPVLGMRIGPKSDNVVKRKVPMPTAEVLRKGDPLGKHQKAAVAVQVYTVDGKGGGGEEQNTSSVQWVGFEQYSHLANEATVFDLKDGRRVSVVFGRLVHPLPGMFMRLMTFEMFPYPHSTQPRDFRSDVQVVRGPGAWEVMERGRILGIDQAIKQGVEAGAVNVSYAYTSLNDPLLLGTFIWSEGRNWFGNVLGMVADRMGPTRFKFSQAGWDNRTWMQSLEAVERGELKKPIARFTILGVGNNPGIHVIATGSILIAMGIPWAFYVKPWILKRRKMKIQKMLAEGTYVVPKKGKRE